jgi:4-alpha-glucanotransferase
MNMNQRRSGILLHITSLPGPNGIGDFGPDAYRFVDWLESAGQTIWQLLPTTPVGPGDSPYQSPSAFAGSPLMIALEPLMEAGWLANSEFPKNGFDKKRVDFRAVIPWRMEQLRKAFEGFNKKASATQHEAFANWRDSQKYWLEDYALFMALFNAAGFKPWWLWDRNLIKREPVAMQKAREQQAQEIRFWEFVQWCFDTQCTALKNYANSKGVLIMSDLPIFIADNSADCWSRPDLYYLDENFQPSVVAGVPPDDLGPLGQRWGNPLYRWDRMAQEDFAWWTDRVRRALTQADMFRIDHFRGFAGYWEIQASSPTAIDGQWLPGPGIALFDAIKKALGDLPIVAEDLGLITPDVVKLRKDCGFPGMKILQFAFGADADHEFLPHNYETDYVVYSGTHDNDTARGWWSNANEKERHFAGTYLAATAADIHWAMIRAASNSVANMAIFPMQDVLGLDQTHRMNLPGSIDINWTWRFDWPMLKPETGRVLGMTTAASGRGRFDLLKN